MKKSFSFKIHVNSELVAGARVCPPVLISLCCLGGLLTVSSDFSLRSCFLPSRGRGGKQMGNHIPCRLYSSSGLPASRGHLPCVISHSPSPISVLAPGLVLEMLAGKDETCPSGIPRTTLACFPAYVAAKLKQMLSSASLTKNGCRRDSSEALAAIFPEEFLEISFFYPRIVP